MTTKLGGMTTRGAATTTDDRQERRRRRPSRHYRTTNDCRQKVSEAGGGKGRHADDGKRAVQGVPSPSNMPRRKREAVAAARVRL